MFTLGPYRQYQPRGRSPTVDASEAIAFRVAAAKAEILVDGQPAGPASSFGGRFAQPKSWLRLPPGRHRVGVTAPGMARQDFLVEVYRVPGQPGEPVLALRTRHELYAEHASGFRELYNIREDPFQLRNFARAAGPGYLKNLSRRLAELSGCSGDDCR